MKVSNRGLAFIAGLEGIVPYPYRDSKNIWTFGVGHTAAAGSPDPAKMARGVEQSIDYVMELFRKDIVKYENGVKNAVRVPLAQHEFDALVSFHYNTGGIARANLTKSLNAGNRARAADQFLGWSKPREIIPRRTREMRLFETGEYGDGHANVYRATSSGSVIWSSAKRVNVMDFLDGEPIELTELDELRAWLSDRAKVIEVQKRVGAKPDGFWGPGTESAVVRWLAFAMWKSTKETENGLALED